MRINAVAALLGTMGVFMFVTPGCGSSGNANGGDAPSFNGTATNCDTPKMGCTCGPPGTRIECGRGACKDGMRKCLPAGGEFSQWGPCMSASTGESCGDTSDGSPGSSGGTSGGTTSGGASGGTNDGSSNGGASGGTSSGGTSGTSGGTSSSGASGGTNDGSSSGASGGTSSGGTSGTSGTSGGSSGTSGTSGTSSGGTGTCVCKPGAQRWCDDPVFCFWGRQTCTPAGTWGKCVETSNPPAGCAPGSYDQDCCVAAGQCCENIAHIFHPELPDSLGNCANITCQ